MDSEDELERRCRPKHKCCLCEDYVPLHNLDGHLRDHHKITNKKHALAFVEEVLRQAEDTGAQDRGDDKSSLKRKIDTGDRHDELEERGKREKRETFSLEKQLALTGEKELDYNFVGPGSTVGTFDGDYEQAPIFEAAAETGPSEVEAQGAPLDPRFDDLIDDALRDDAYLQHLIDVHYEEDTGTDTNEVRHLAPAPVQAKPKAAEPVTAVREKGKKAIGDDSNDEEEPEYEGEIRVGGIFHNYDEFKEKFDTFQKETYSHYRIRSSAKLEDGDKSCPYKKVRFVCIHFQNPALVRKEPTTHSRPGQSYFARACPAQVSIYYNTEREIYKITSMMENHENHECSEETYSLLAPGRRVSAKDSKEIVKRANQYGSSNSALKRVIAEETGKIVTGQDVRNIRRRGEGKEDLSDIEKVIRCLEERKEKDTDSSISLLYGDSSSSKFGSSADSMKVIYYQSSRQKELVRKFGNVLFWDGTYNVTRAGYVLYPFVCVDSDNRSRLAAWAFSSSETRENLMEVLQCFKEANEGIEDKLTHIMVDKDCSEISSINRIFPNAKVIICQWHAINAVQKRIDKCHLSREEQHIKKKMKTLFVSLAKSRTEEGYFASWTKMAEINGSPPVQDLKYYMEKQWHDQRAHWALHCLKDEPIMCNYTNNRSENMNAQIKKKMTTSLPMSDAMKILFDVEDAHAAIGKFRRIELIGKTYIPSGLNAAEEEIVESVEGLISKRIVKVILAQFKQSSFVSDAGLSMQQDCKSCPQLDGPCSFSINYGLPCCHLFHVRKVNKEQLCPPNLIPPRWRLAEEGLEMQKRKGSNTSAISTRKVRYNAATQEQPVKRLTQIMSQCSPEEAAETSCILNVVADALENNVTQNLTIVGGKSDSSQEKRVLIDNIPVKLSPKKTGRYVHKNETTTRKKEKENERTGPKETGQENMENAEREERRAFNAFYRKAGLKFAFNDAEFDILEGTADSNWLNDLHVEAANIILRKQFPDVQGLFDPTLYKENEFPAIDVSKDFLQVCHSGDIHWSVLTNIGVPKESRQRECILYDTLLHYENGHSAEIKPAIQWQVSQLFRNETCKNSASLRINVRPVMQQSNSDDCGVLAIMNAVMALMRYDLGNVVYSGNPREELRKMLFNGVLCSFEHHDRRKEDRSLFSTPVTVKGISDFREIKSHYFNFDTICYCLLPENFNNVVVCEQCHECFHMKCVGVEDKIAKKMQFDCFSCICARERNRGQIPFETRQKIINGMSRIGSVRLTQMLLKCHRNIHFQSAREYSEMIDFVKKYQLHRFSEKSGCLYAPFKNWITKYMNDVSPKLMHRYLSLNKQIYLMVMVICDIEEVTLVPFSTEEHEEIDLSKPGNVATQLKKYTPLLKDLSQFLEKKKKKIDKLSPSTKTYWELIGDVTDIEHDLEEMKKQCREALEAIENADVYGAKKADLEKQKQLLEQFRSLECDAELLGRRLQAFRKR